MVLRMSHPVLWLSCSLYDGKGSWMGRGKKRNCRKTCEKEGKFDRVQKLRMLHATKVEEGLEQLVVPQFMRAAVYRGKQDVRLETVPVPEIGPGELLVRLHTCGICGTDLK